ncbi:MAG: lipoyl(octanoyl) transferase LipB [Burkholderiaceae bacterium]|nr:lipoyl(octanoyl) transferase LipB [Burkholderiaceae bacterium]
MAISALWLPGPADYDQVWQSMRDFTERRQPDTPDQLWLTQHAPVYTLGQAGKPEHVLNTADIPVIYTDRGGQVTYHGPGQVMVYCLIDLRRYKLYVKEYVELLEGVLISTLQDLGLHGACRKPGAPGVYVPVPSSSPGNPDELAKIAALGIKIRHGCAYHGLALNVDMDLSPFHGINPCGYVDLQSVDLRRCGVQLTVTQAGDLLASALMAALTARCPE